EIVVRLSRGSASSVRHTALTHEQLNAHNTFEKPDVVSPRTAAVKAHGATVNVVLPPASVNRLEIQLA
ncbi:MAG: alpha-L-arabinofuranosidase, partial [Planctomycetes bacterium]|nr:alpha-L-arabinofuranosidase [Planctomycetota bacterium]